MNVKEFKQSYPLYDQALMNSYLVYRDILIKNEVDGLHGVDGTTWGFESYIFMGKVKYSGKERAYVPISFDAELMLTP